MRKPISAFAITLCLLLQACSSDDGDQPANAGCNSAADTFSAEVNGEAFCAVIGRAQPALLDANGHLFYMVNGSMPTGNGTRLIALYLPLETGTYDGSDPFVSASYSPNMLSENPSLYVAGEEAQQSQLEITVTEVNNSRIKGTFEFTAFLQAPGTSLDYLNERVTVTNGSFDVPIVQIPSG